MHLLDWDASSGMQLHMLLEYALFQKASCPYHVAHRNYRDGKILMKVRDIIKLFLCIQLGLQQKLLSNSTYEISYMK